MLKRFILLICTVIVMSIPASAQLPIFDRAGDRVAETLSFVPDSPEVRESFVSYINYAGLQATGPYGVLDPASSVDFGTFDDFEQSLWTHRSFRWQAGPEFFRAISEVIRDEIENPINGFDFFAINEAVVYGNPPSNGQVIAADYDPLVFADAQTAFGYEQTTLGGLEAWCSVDGCDVGLEADFRESEPGNLFDPSALGRKPPVIVTENYLASAFDLNVIRDSANAFSGEAHSIMDVPDYSTILAAVTDAEQYAGDLLQLIYLRVEPQPMGIEVLRSMSMFSEGDDLQLPVSWENYGDLPPYLMVAIADRQEGDDQVAMVAVLYDNAENAQIAADELAVRLSNFSGEIRTRLDDPFLDDVPGAVVESHVFQRDDLYVAIGQVRYELPPETPEMLDRMLSDEEVGYEGPRFQGYFIRRFIESVYSFAFDVLWDVTIDE